MRFQKLAAVSLVAAGALMPLAASAGPAATFNWSGAYVGGNVGYGWGQTTTGETHMYNDIDGLDEYSGSPLPSFTYSGSGLIGGGEAGYNWQSGNFVVGVVGDLAAANITGTYTDSSALFSVDTTIKWLGTARLNIGMPMGNTLFYGTGGLAVGGVTSGLHDVYGLNVIDSSASTTNVGWTLGAGVATAVASNWIVKAEYLYVDLGSKPVTFSEPDPGFPLITSSGKSTASVFKFAIDYKF